MWLTKIWDAKVQTNSYLGAKALNQANYQGDKIKIKIFDSSELVLIRQPNTFSDTRDTMATVK